MSGYRKQPSCGESPDQSPPAASSREERQLMPMNQQSAPKYDLSDAQKKMIVMHVTTLEAPYLGSNLFDIAQMFSASCETPSDGDVKMIEEIIKVHTTVKSLLDEYPNNDDTLGTMRDCITNERYECTWALSRNYIGKLRLFFTFVQTIQNRTPNFNQIIAEKDAKIAKKDAKIAQLEAIIEKQIAVIAQLQENSRELESSSDMYAKIARKDSQIAHLESILEKQINTITQLQANSYK